MPRVRPVKLDLHPGDPVQLYRGGATLFTGEAVRQCRQTRDYIIGNVRHPDGRVVIATGANGGMPLQIRASVSGVIRPLSGFGGEMKVRAAT